MINKRTIFEIHALNTTGLSHRQIAKKLGLSRISVKKYLENPEKTFEQRTKRTSKLEPFQELIDGFLEDEPRVKAPVVLQRLQEKGFDGKITIVRDYLKMKRGQYKNRKAFVRFESPPGKNFQVDWGHFGSLKYGNTKRKLYCLAVTESYSRMTHLEFTHSQNQATLHQALMNIFRKFGGTPEELVVDNMLTAVIERMGKVIRFNESFLDFLRPFKIVPYACNVRAPHEKGKVERVIGYVRQNFWPLRKFIDRDDVQRQANHWCDTIANVRIHQTTGVLPTVRFEDVQLKPIPELSIDYREICHPLVYKDFEIQFDCNFYTAPPWTIGKRITLKADQNNVTLYYKDKRIAIHPRSLRFQERV